jgi:tight adherence protein C
VYVSFFLALFLFCIGISQFLKQRTVRNIQIQKIKGQKDFNEITMDKSSDAFAKTKKSSKITNAFAKFGNFIIPNQSQDNSIKRLKFLRAGIRNKNANASFWGAKILLMVFLTLIFFIIRFLFFNIMNYHTSLAISVLCSLLGFYLPDIWLRQKSDNRKEKILRALPDALDLLVISVEAGMGMDSSIYRVANEIKLNSPELSDELHFMNLELRAGKTRKDALKNFALRTNLEEINSLATLLIQTDQFGTSMADALRVYSDSFRTERFQKAEELAAKLPVKLLFPLVAFIFPALFVVLLGPAAISIYNAFLKQ